MLIIGKTLNILYGMVDYMCGWYTLSVVLWQRKGRQENNKPNKMKNYIEERSNNKGAGGRVE